MKHYFLIAALPLYISLLFLFGNSSVPLQKLSSLLKAAFNSTFRQQSLHYTTSTLTQNFMDQSKIVLRRSDERGHADHGWLKTFHTFTFANYQAPEHEKFGSLRVINEDRVAAGTGFGTHSHREFEIFSYVVAGQLEHKDSMGNTEILKRGDIQMTSAGTGISHSEKAYGSKQVHFLQIWSFPDQPRLSPKYFTRHFSDADKTDKFACVVAHVNEEGVLKDEREGSGPAPVNSPLTLYATLLSPGKSLTHAMKGKKGYIHVVQTSGYNPGTADGGSVKFTAGRNVDADLREGDGAYLFIGPEKEVTIENTGNKITEVLLFDLD